MPMILDYIIGIFRFFLSKYVFITQNFLRKFNVKRDEFYLHVPINSKEFMT